MTQSGQRGAFGKIQNLLRSTALGTQRADAQTIVTLGKAGSGPINNEITMVETRLRKLKSASQQNLTGRRFQQIRATNNLSDLHLSIIHYDRKLVGRNVIPPENDEVSEINTCKK